MLEPWERGECIGHIPKSMSTLSPGPAHYHISRSFKNRCPTILIKARHFQKEDRIDAAYVKLPTLVGKVTPITLHQRTDIDSKFKTPAPTYVPPRFGASAPKIGISSPAAAAGKAPGESPNAVALGRRHDPDATIGPGPAKSLLRDHCFDATGKEGITIKGFHDFNYDQSISPGPAAYRPKYHAILPRAPIYGFHVRPKTKDPEGTPGYRDLGSTLGRSPKWTMKARALDEIAII
jgi:hypothetical protein